MSSSDVPEVHLQRRVDVGFLVLALTLGAAFDVG